MTETISSSSSSHNSPALFRRYFAIVGVVFLVTNAFLHAPTRSNNRHLLLRKNATNISKQQNRLLRALKQQYQRQCRDEASTKEDLMQTLSAIMNMMSLSHTSQAEADNPVSTSNSNNNNRQETDLIMPCRYTFIDFGANIGDSLGKFIDSGFEPCPEKGIPKHPRLDLTMEDNNNVNNNNHDGPVVEFHERENILVRSSSAILKQRRKGQKDDDVGPEDYCYYGVEGNPHFTERLQELERRILQLGDNNSSTRPVRHVHFLTETVGTGHDGPTVLFLDTINTEQNFWGSSLLAGHRDVKKSAAAAAATHNRSNTLLQKAPVQGVTLTTLLRQTVQPVAGAHVMIKMDIEGGEYAVLEEAYQSGIMCEYHQAGVTIHLLLETHRPKDIGATDFDLQHWRHVKKTLTEDCGVILQKGRDAGR